MSLSMHRARRGPTPTPSRSSFRQRRKRGSSKTGIRFLKRLNLPPGRYHFRVGAHDTATGSIGTVSYDLDVPDFRKLPFSMSGLLVTSREATVDGDRARRPRAAEVHERSAGVAAYVPAERRCGGRGGDLRLVWDRAAHRRHCDDDQIARRKGRLRAQRPALFARTAGRERCVRADHRSCLSASWRRAATS